jgi:hypothetical protein
VGIRTFFFRKKTYLIIAVLEAGEDVAEVYYKVDVENK